MIIIGIIFIVLALISYLLAPESNEYVALIIIAGLFFLAAKMDSLYNKFINNYYRPANNGNLASKADSSGNAPEAPPMERAQETATPEFEKFFYSYH